MTVHFIKLVLYYTAHWHVVAVLVKCTVHISSNEYNDDFILLLQTNTFQAVMVTDGNNSFAIFIYQCGDLQWSRNGTTIGFGAGSEFFSNHWLSGTPNVSSIACLNTPDSQFFTLLYKLTEPRYSKGEAFVVV